MESTSIFKIILLDAASLGKDIDLSPLQSLPNFVSYDSTSRAQWNERVQDACILISNNISYTTEKLAYARNLKLICVTSSGYDHVDLSWRRAHGMVERRKQSQPLNWLCGSIISWDMFWEGTPSNAAREK